MDIFAVALEDSDRIDATVDIGAKLAPSQDIAGTEELEMILFDDCMEISDDIAIGALSVEPAIAHVLETPEKVSRTKHTSSQSHHCCGTKRKHNPKNSLQLKRIESVDGSDVPCIFVKKGSRQMVVPLWCQYRATWRDEDFENAKWISVSNYDSWVMGLVNAVTRHSVREVAKTFTDCFRKQFQTCMATARRARNLGNALSDSESENTTGIVGNNAEEGSAVVEVAMGDFILTCLNSNRRMALKLDEVTVRFISGWIVPLMKVCASSKAPSQDNLGSVPAVPVKDESQKFHLSVSPTPNIRDKVWWNPTAHAWEVFIKLSKGKPSENFAVDPAQSADTYEKQKIDAYRRAVEAWNWFDSSKRFRIPTTRLPVSCAAD